MVNKKTSFLRYPGGKQRLLEYIIDHLPKKENIKGKYLEPFVGGGAVFFSLSPQKAILSDLNKELIDLYKGIKKDPEEVWEIYCSFPSSKDGYYEVRDSFTSKKLAARAARTLFLNRTCFKGMWRHNSKGKFNVGYGGQDRRWVINKSLLEKVAEKLKNVKLTVADFEKVIDSAVEGDFIFLDPPYTPGKREMEEAHYVYAKFIFDDHVRLAKALERASNRGVRWAMTNSSHEDILQLFTNCSIIGLQQGTGNRPGILTKETGEALITN